MARLVLSLDGQVLAEYNMNKERYTVGRLPDNDIRIDNPAVSGHHALVINILNDSFLEDLNSTNGTYVNGKIIKKHALQHGDTITVGHHSLRFVDGETEEQDDEFEKTMVIGPRGSVRVVPAQVSAAAATNGAASGASAATAAAGGAAEAKSEPAAAAPPAGSLQASQLRRAKLQVLSGQFAGRELELIKTLTTLGRPGIQVAAITRRADGYYVVHVESGKENDFPLVNGSPIGQQARRLHDNDVLQLAGVKMGFFES
jgi:pSer/pThr/pTyr-binding forkhead associated (FHA) protein